MAKSHVKPFDGTNISIEGNPAEIAKKQRLEVMVEDDYKRFQKIFKPCQDQIFKAIRRRAYTESFILSWALLEQILLPSLIRQIAHKLSLKKVPKLYERTQAAQLINYYYFLSHDLELFNHLIEANRLRRGIVHKLQSDFDANTINIKSKKATKYIQINTVTPILERLAGKTSIPVLTLRARGWNEAVAEFNRKVKAFLES